MVFPARAVSRVTAAGSLLGESFSLEFKGGTFIDNFIQRRWPIELIATGGGAELRIEGTVRQPEGETGSELDFALIGEQVGDLASWIGVSSEGTLPYRLSGKAMHTARGVRTRIDKAQIGDSAFSGEVGIRQENNTPITFAKLKFNTINLKALTGLFPAAPETKRPKTGRKALTIDVPILPQGIEIFDSDLRHRHRTP